MADVDTQRTKAELISAEQELAKKADESVKSKTKEHVMSSEDLGVFRPNNKIEQKSEVTFENHVNGASSSNPEEDAKNDAVSSGEVGQSKNNLVVITDSEGDLVKNIVVKSVEWVQIESDGIGKAGKHFETVQQKNGMEGNPETANFENHIHAIRVADIGDDKSKSVSEDIENNNVDINIKDDMKNDDLSSKENELVENNGEKGLNDDSVDLTPGHENEIEQIPEMTFENILAQDSTTLNSQEVIEDIFTSGQIKIQDNLKDDDVGTKECVQIKSNLAYMRKEGDDRNDEDLEIQEQHDNEMKKTVEMAIESYDHDIDPLNSQTIENNFDSRKREDAKICIHEDLKQDLNSRRERAEIVLADMDIHKSVAGNNEHTMNSGALPPTEGQLIESNLADFGEDTHNEFVSMQLQHEKEMQELRTNLQDEYQNQVLKISDELREHYQNDMDEKIAKLEEDWELEFTRQTREFDGQVSAVRREQWTQCQEAIERVTLDAEDQLKNMKYSYERETAEHKQRIRELLEREALWEMKEKELTNEKSDRENESMSKIKKLENQLSLEREEIEAQLSSSQNEIKALRKQHEIETENLTNELDKKYSDILDEMRKELKSKYQDEMDDKVNQVKCHLREQYEQDLEKTKEEIQQTTSTLKTKYEKQVAETLLQLEELHERNQEHESREARLKGKFQSEKAKVAALLNEVGQKTKIVEEFEQKKKDLEEKFKLCLSEKCSLEEKVKGNSGSTTEETVDLQEELARKSNVIHDMEQQVKDSENKLKKLEEKLQNLTLEKDSTEKKLNEDLKSEKLNVEGLRNELQMKEKEIKRLQHEELEDKIRTKVLEGKPLDGAEQAAGSQNNEITSSQQDLLNETQEFKDEVKNDKKKDKSEELEIKLHEITLERQSLQQQLVDSKSEKTSLQEKLKENENIASQLKSNYDTKILQITQNYEEEVNALKNELKLKKNGEEEISKLNKELQKHKAVISELEETSRGREIEIANLILNSPSPHGLTDQEFDFSVNSGDRTQQLESELAKYKKKVQELEEEAEDKFETSLCPNCQDREKSEEILIQTKVLVDKMKLDCEKKVESVSKDLEKTENALQEQIEESKDLKAKLEKAEEDLREERKRSLEISNIGKHFYVSRNVLGHEENSKDIPGTEVEKTKDEQIKTLKPGESELGLEDSKTHNDERASKLPSNKDFESLFDEQEKFYKHEISRKDEEISHLMSENTKTQEQIQNVKEKFNEGAAQYEQLKIRTLEQKTKYENEINLMQKEIEILIQQNKEVKDQLKILQAIQNEADEIRRKLKESENVVHDKCQETKDLNAKLQETENILKQNSGKYEQEIVVLKETVKEKENRMLDLRNSLDLLEKTRKGLEMDLSNQKQEFSERERSLLHEISEMTIAFEEEKAKILEDSFLDKEEMKQKVHGLEMLNHEYNFRSAEDDLRGYEGVDGDNLPEGHTGDGDTFGYEKLPIGYSYKTRNIREHEWINVDRKATRGIGKEMVPARSEKVKYEEINYHPLEKFEHTDEMHADDDDEVLKIGEETERRIRKGSKHKQELAVLSDLKREVMKDEYALFDDTEFDNPFQEGSPESLFSDQKYKEIGCEENLELLKYEHDIDLLLARKENERLRAEIGTLTDCVDVFHDECDSLKRSLDKTLNMVGMLRHERDALMKKHDSNMAEHSELVLDLIKYEETIHRLERGNEKLEEDRKLLEECLLGKQSMSFHESPSENQARLTNDPKAKTNFALQDDRRDEYNRKLLEECLVEKQNMLFQEKQGKLLYNNTSYSVQDEHRKLLQDRRAENQTLLPKSPATECSLQLDSEVATFLPGDTPILRTKSEYEINETEFQRKGNKYKNVDANFLGKHEVLERKERPMLEDLVKETELERKIMDDLLPDKAKDRKKDTVDGMKMQFATDNEEAFAADFARTLPSMGSTRDVKTQTQDGNRRPIRQDINGYSFKNISTTESMLNHSKQRYGESATSPRHAQTEGSRPFSKYRYKVQTSSELNIPTTQPHKKEMKSLQGTKLPGKTTIKSNPRLVVMERSSLPGEKAGTSSKFKNSSIEFPRSDEITYSSHNSVDVMRNVTPSSRFTKRTGRNGITERQKPSKSNSKRMSGNASTPSSSNYSGSSILTSTRANLTTSDRLVPNLSGLSPIVSPLDRHYHAEKLRWQIVEDERSNTSRPNHGNTTFLLNIDPNELLQIPTTANNERLVSSRTRTHNRSRSADDRLLTREMTSSRELYQEKPLLINFEDFICRHRVKSSEDVANIRDPSPAEQWFS